MREDSQERGIDIQCRFRGSDDDLRSKFEEYICSALSTMKYADYIVSGQTLVPMPGGESSTIYWFYQFHADVDTMRRNAS
jgi:hypothetical protein